MILYHTTHTSFEGFKEDTSKILDWGGAYEVDGLWCSDSKEYAINIYKQLYCNREYNQFKILTLETKFDEDKVFDTRLPKDFKYFAEELIVEPAKGKFIPISRFIIYIYEESKNDKPTLYWDIPLQLPIFIVADIVKPALMKLDYKACVYSETIPSINYQLSEDIKLSKLDYYPSIQIFNPLKDLNIVKEELIDYTTIKN